MLHTIKLLCIKIIDNAGRKKYKAFAYRNYSTSHNSVLTQKYMVGSKLSHDFVVSDISRQKFFALSNDFLFQFSHSVDLME